MTSACVQTRQRIFMFVILVVFQNVPGPADPNQEKLCKIKILKEIHPENLAMKHFDFAYYDSLSPKLKDALIMCGAFEAQYLAFLAPFPVYEVVSVPRCVPTPIVQYGNDATLMKLCDMTAVQVPV